MDADCKQPWAPELEPAAADPSEASVRGKTMNFYRLYKARSLDCLVKERILVEASHCQYEIWKRFGHKGEIVGMVNPSDVNMNGPTLLPTPAKLSSVTCSSSTECFTSLAQCHSALHLVLKSRRHNNPPHLLPQILPAFCPRKSSHPFLRCTKFSTKPCLLQSQKVDF